MVDKSAPQKQSLILRLGAIAGAIATILGVVFTLKPEWKPKESTSPPVGVTAPTVTPAPSDRTNVTNSPPSGTNTSSPVPLRGPYKVPIGEARKLIGSWEIELLHNNIPYIMVYTFNPDGSFLSSSATGDNKLMSRFEYQRGHASIEWEDGKYEYAQLLMFEDKFQYRIVEHPNQAAIGREVIFRRQRR